MVSAATKLQINNENPCVSLQKVRKNVLFRAEAGKNTAYARTT